MERELVSTTDMGEYDIRVELWQFGPDDTPPTEMTSAYTKSGAYIGNPDTATFLIGLGIAPELRTETSNVCSIGFNTLEQRWFGWSHRAIHGFAVGDVVQEGDVIASPVVEGRPSDFPVGTVIGSLDEAKEAAMSFAEAVG